MLGRGKVRLDRLFRLGPGRGLGKRRNLQELVDRGGFGSLLGEPVALRECRDFVGVNPIDQPVEVLAKTGVGPRSVRRLEQHFDGAVEFDSRAIEVA